MRRLVATLIVLAACNSILGIQSITPNHTDGGPDTGDAPVDVPADASFCLTPHLNIATLCAPLAGDVVLPATVDTSTGCTVVWPGIKGIDACVIAGKTITTNTAVVRAIGPRMLILLAAESITIPSPFLLDASSGRGGVGPGAMAAKCKGELGSAAGDSTQGGGGGAGGGLQGSGGDGGGGNGAKGGTALAPFALVDFLPGCTGGSGGMGSGLAPSGGYGGGAVYLLAGVSIDVSGQINVSGTGGGGATGSTASGGGGGGAGGMIVLDAPAITVSGTLLASGAGGGGGNDGSLMSGSAGAEPQVSNPASIPSGGAGGGSGGAGGPGTSTIILGGGGATTSCTTCGGGGGGGGAGFIVVFGATLGSNSNIVPTPQQF